jgi:riboflavin-specific deaminase-like protein
MSKPYVIASCAMSLDGYIDDTTPERLLLSNDADFDRVDQVRAASDAILVGANTIRRDNPRLLVRSQDRRTERLEQGRTETPLKVAIAGTRPLDANASFFTAGNTDKLIYTASPTVRLHRTNVGDHASVVDAGDPLSLRTLLADLSGRGVGQLMIEGGTTIHTQFLAAGLVDELHLVIAPLLVGDPDAPRFVGPACFPNDAANRMTLTELRPIGDVIFARLRT